jgi:hypothetical protein
MSQVRSLRRYYLLKARWYEDLAETEILSEGFWAKQNAVPGRELGDIITAVAKLRAAHYTTIEDVVGADIGELVEFAGLTGSEARTVLHTELGAYSMGYQMANGRFANTIDIVPLAAAALTVTGTSPVIEVGDRGTMRLTANFTAVTGTNPTWDCVVMTCDTAGGTFRQVIAGTFTQMTSATSQRKSFVGLDRFVRLDYTLGGTNPSFTGTISGELV